MKLLRVPASEGARLRVARLAGIRKYALNYSLAVEGKTAPPHDAVVELWFDSQEAFEQALASEDGQRALADQEQFLDVEKTVMLAVDEVSVA